MNPSCKNKLSKITGRIGFPLFLLFFCLQVKGQNHTTTEHLPPPVLKLSIIAAKSIAAITTATKISNAALVPPSISYPTPQTYNINTPIAPLTPVNTGGAIPASGFGQVVTVPASISAAFNQVTGVVVDANGNLYAGDFNNNQVKEITPAGTFSVFAGSGSAGSANGTGTSAMFFEPDALAMDKAGNIYVSDLGNNLIRKMSPAAVVTTFAGSGSTGAIDGVGTAASFSVPRGLTIDNNGNVYVADQGNNLIRKITPAGLVSTVAGNGLITTFNTPTGVDIDATGNIYVSDSGNSRVLKITPTGVVTVYGNNTVFQTPRELRVDGLGNIYVADIAKNQVIRISPAGTISVLAGSGVSGTTDGIGTAATFSGPLGLVLDGKGTLYVTDDNSNLIRKISLGGYAIDKTLPPGLQFDPQTGIISGTPTTAWPPTDYTVTATNAAGTASALVNITVLATALQPSVITFPPPSNVLDGNNNFNPGATSTNTETPITYTSSDTSIAIVLPNGLVHVIAPGIVYITAHQSGNANYADASPVSEEVIIIEQQVITFPPLPNKTVCDADFTAKATSNNTTIPIAYQTSDPTIATITRDGLIHIVGPGTVTITATQNGTQIYAEAVPKTQTLTVVAALVPVVNVTANAQSICTGMQVIFTAAVSNAGTNPIYQWQLNGVNAGTNSPTFAVTNIANTDKVQCTVTADDNCKKTTTSNSVTGIITQNYITPALTIKSSINSTVCSGTNFTFTATATNSGTNPSYQWLVNGNPAGPNNAIFNSTTLASGDVVTCVVTNNGGACLTSNTATSNAINVSIFPAQNPAPVISISASSNNVYKGTPVTFTAGTANAVTITGFQWQVNGVDAGTSSPVFVSNTLNNGDVVTCILSSGNPCTIAVKSLPVVMSILPPPTVTIPNAFTPNGDGVNDNWNIPDLTYYPNCVVRVYTRYGGLVYESRGYSKAWNGVYNGSKLPTGTYYYLINLGNNSKPLSGYVAIL